MLILFEINGVPTKFGLKPEGSINTIQIRTSGLTIAISFEQVAYVKAYLKDLVQNMTEDGYVIYNGILIYKNDINLDI